MVKVRIPVVSAFYDGRFGLAQGSRESEKCCIRRNGNKNSEIQEIVNLSRYSPDVCPAACCRCYDRCTSRSVSTFPCD